MEKTWAKVEPILQHFAINYERRGWCYLCDLEGSQFYYSPQTGKWRIKGSRVWKSSRTVRDFIAQARAYCFPESRANQSQKKPHNSRKKSAEKQQNNRQKNQEYQEHQQ
jgi:hypothetical protein